MVKIQKHIEIVRCTSGDLISLATKSAASVHAVLSRHYETVNISIVNDMPDLLRLISKNPDLIFLGGKILPINNGAEPLWLSSYIEAAGIAHTGSTQAAIELESNKLLAKQQIIDAGLRSPKYVKVSTGTPLLGQIRGLIFPLFVKPTDLGGGMGIDNFSVVHSVSDLQTKVASLQKLYVSDIMIEEYLPGREFSVAVLANGPNGALTAMPVELIPTNSTDGYQIQDYLTKSTDDERVLYVTDDSCREIISTFACDAFEALGARDYGRIDVRLDAEGHPNFIEANLIPGLGEVGGYFPAACLLNAGMSYEQVILEIVELALARRANESADDLVSNLALSAIIQTA